MMETVQKLALREAQAADWADHALNTGWIFRATYDGVSRFPAAWSYGIGNLATWLAYHLMSDLRRGIASNLRGAFPELTERQIGKITLLTLRSYAKDTIDLMRNLHKDRESLSPLVSHIDRSVFERLLSRGRGILLAGAHVGNWELGGVFLRRLFDFPLTVVVMSERSAEVNEMRRSFRRSMNVETLEVRQSLDTPLQIVRLLSENRIVAMLLDRHMDRDRVEVRFLGRRAYFLRTPALLGYLSGAPLLPALVVRQADGRFSGLTGDPIYVNRFVPREESLAVATQSFASFLEPVIRQYPHLWYQFYPYWERQEQTQHD